MAGAQAKGLDAEASAFPGGALGHSAGVAIDLTFRPTPWLSGGHAQTMWASRLRPLPQSLINAEHSLPDGDVVGWQRTGDPAGRPAVLLLPGLEGSADSPYATRFMAAWSRRGWCGAILHHRGAACRPNRLVRGCHSGDWQDAVQVVAELRRLGATAVAAVGVSLGGNVLLNWLGESGAACPLVAAVAVSVPYDLDACARALDRGLARIYRRHLLRDMRASMLAKRHLNGFTPGFLNGLRTFRQFDDAITAPQNGFAGVDDYYRRCSSGQRVGGIRIPTTLIHADDDPFVPVDSVPAVLPSEVRAWRSPHGGHVGFLQGAWPRPWLPMAVTTALADLTGW